MTVSRLVHLILLGSISVTFLCRHCAEYSAKRSLQRKLLEKIPFSLHKVRILPHLGDWLSPGLELQGHNSGVKT